MTPTAALQHNFQFSKQVDCQWPQIIMPGLQCGNIHLLMWSDSLSYAHNHLLLLQKGLKGKKRKFDAGCLFDFYHF